MSEILIEGFSTEEAFKALCENNETSLPSSDAEYFLVIANELGFDLEFYAKLVNREELVSEIIRYIELDRFDTSADILSELPENEFEKAIEDLCMAAAGEEYLEDVGILIKNKDGKVISGIDFTLSLVDELQDYEAGNDVIQKLKNQQPFTFTYERDISDYVDVYEAFKLLNSDTNVYEKLLEHINPTVSCRNCGTIQSIERDGVCSACKQGLVSDYVSSILDSDSEYKLIFNGDTVSKAVSNKSRPDDIVVRVSKEFFDCLVPTIHKDTAPNSDLGAFLISELKEPLLQIVTELRGHAKNGVN